MGKEVLREKLENGLSKIMIAKLSTGIYMAEIITKGKTVYQQKIIKK